MHYVIGDIHGQIHALKRLLDKLDLKPEDKVYFVGDWFDRAFTQQDMQETVEWMLEHLTEGSRFSSVLGNHDLDCLHGIDSYLQETDNDMQQLFEFCVPEYIKKHCADIKAMIESMPIYQEFSVNGRDYLVTHSWLWDRSEKTLGDNGFDIKNLDVCRCIWDRFLSVQAYDSVEKVPIVIHGHTPTFSYHAFDIWKDGCRALSGIHRVTESNINVDCGAFYSPLRGGNLAAYCCEDDTAIYAYEEGDFFHLVNAFFEEMPLGDVNITKEEWYFAVLFRNQGRMFAPGESRVLVPENEEIKLAYDKYRKFFENCNEEDFAFEILDYERRVKAKLEKPALSYWVLYRERL